MQKFPRVWPYRRTDKNIHSSRFKYYFDLNANCLKQKSISIFTRHHRYARQVDMCFSPTKNSVVRTFLSPCFNIFSPRHN